MTCFVSILTFITALNAFLKMKNYLVVCSAGLKNIYTQFNKNNLKNGMPFAQRTSKFIVCLL